MKKGYSGGKRQREAERARKRLEKAERKENRRERGVDGIPITTAEAITGPLVSSEEAMRMMEERSSQPRDAGQVPVRLFVGGLSSTTTDETIRKAFAEFGVVNDAVVIKDRDTGESRQFGFVEMAGRHAAARAIEGLEGAELDGSVLRVSIAADRPPRRD